VIQATKKTTAITFVANAGSDGIDADEKSVGVAIDTDVCDFQNMAARLALFPKLVARAGKENHFASALRKRERFGIHEAEHENVARGLILDNGWKAMSMIAP